MLRAARDDDLALAHGGVDEGFQVLRGAFVGKSKGQLIENPLSRINMRLAKEIRQMEDRFGMNPNARAQFAVAMGDLARTMDDLAKGVTAADDDSDPLQIVDVSDASE